MQRFLIIIVSLLITMNAYSQSIRWKQERHSIVFAAGVSHFMGDLGGGAEDAAHFFGVRDLDIEATRPVLAVSYRYRLFKPVALKAGLGWALIAADDKNSKSIGRNLRNLHFRSNLFSVHFHAEYYFLQENLNPRYVYSHVHSLRNFSAYVFLGASYNMFNPKAKLDGKWLELQPLCTEGQGIDDNPAPYKKHAFGFPIGLGVKYAFTRNLTIGIEISNTYTTSDYIDDTHHKYFDNERIRSTYGEDAARLADRHLQPDGTPHLVPKPSGHPIRGNPNYNDAFIFTNVTLTYKLLKDRRGLPKFR